MGEDRFSRRDFFKTTLAGALLGAAPALAGARGRSPGGRGRTRLVVLGFDGVDPRLVERFMRAGQLPELSRLARRGGFSALASTSPPNSPVAWTTFATGRAPAEHGVFGFLERDPKTYLPGTAPYTVRGPRFAAGGVRPPVAVSHRRGQAWWERLDRAGVPCELLWVPYAFPPPALAHGRVISGLGVPDARFTNSSFTLYTTEPGATRSVAGGRIVRLSPAGSAIDTRLDGPRGPGGAFLSVPLRLELDRRAGRLTVALGKRRETLAQGGRSGWFPLRFEAPGFALAGRVRFHLLSLGPELGLYCSPIQIDPGQAVLPLGAPAGWLTRAVADHALPTVGWVHDTSAVNAGVLPKEVFLADLLDTMAARADLLQAELASGFARVLTAVFTATDRAAHMFYRELGARDGGPLGRVYRAMDAVVGRVRRRLPPGARLVVLSDHGFHPFDRQLHVNTWLEAQGLLTRRRPGGKVAFLRGVDWANTRAYALGNGQLYVNLRGREHAGAVAPGAERAALLEKLTTGLVALRDPKTGARPVRALYPVADRAAAELRARAPDLQIAFASGWRSSWETSLGGAPTGDFLADNPKAWCGDHAASDVVETSGVLLADHRPNRSDPDLRDLANSILTLAGQRPAGPGRPLWT